MPLLQVPVDACFPNLCITCGGAVEFQVTRTYCLDSWVEAKKSRRLQVPACSECARAMLAYPRYQLLAAGAGMFLLALAILLISLGGGLSAGLSLLAMAAVARLFWNFHGVYGPQCRAMGARTTLLKVPDTAFVQAWYDSLPAAEPLDYVERALNEGISPLAVAQAVEAAGYSTKESFEMVTRSLQERKAYSRRQGLRSLGRGVVYSLVGLVVGCLAPGALVVTMGPGLVHSLSGLRRLLG